MASAQLAGRLATVMRTEILARRPTPGIQVGRWNRAMVLFAGALYLLGCSHVPGTVDSEGTSARAGEVPGRAYYHWARARRTGDESTYALPRGRKLRDRAAQRQMRVLGFAADRSVDLCAYRNAVRDECERTYRSEVARRQWLEVVADLRVAPELRAYAVMILGLAGREHPPIVETLLAHFEQDVLPVKLAVLAALALSSWAETDGVRAASLAVGCCWDYQKEDLRGRWRVLREWGDRSYPGEGKSHLFDVGAQGRVLQALRGMKPSRIERHAKGEIAAGQVIGAALLFGLDGSTADGREFAEEVAARALDGDPEYRPLLEAALYLLAARHQRTSRQEVAEPLLRLSRRVRVDDPPGLALIALALVSVGAEEGRAELQARFEARFGPQCAPLGPDLEEWHIRPCSSFRQYFSLPRYTESGRASGAGATPAR